MLKIDTTPRLYAPEKAVKIAAEMQAGDPDWTYTAVNPDGSKGPYSAIEIRDEDGEVIGYA